MRDIDAKRIEKLTNEKISYDLFKKEEQMKIKKFKTSAIALAICVFSLFGTMTVNAATDGAIADGIKEFINITVNEKDYQAKYTKTTDGNYLVSLGEDVVGGGATVEIEVSPETAKNGYDVSYDVQSNSTEVSLKETIKSKN